MLTQTYTSCQLKAKRNTPAYQKRDTKVLEIMLLHGNQCESAEGVGTTQNGMHRQIKNMRPIPEQKHEADQTVE